MLAQDVDDNGVEMLEDGTAVYHYRGRSRPLSPEELKKYRRCWRYVYRGNRIEYNNRLAGVPQ